MLVEKELRLVYWTFYALRSACFEVRRTAISAEWIHECKSTVSEEGQHINNSRADEGEYVAIDNVRPGSPA